MPSIFKGQDIFSYDEGAVKIPEGPTQLFMVETEEGDLDLAEEAYQQEHGETDLTDAGFQDQFIPAVMTRQELTQHYQSELDVICQEAAQKAYSEAVARKRGEMTECMQRVDEQLEKMQKLQAEYMERYAHELKYLAIEIAEKMIFHKINDDDTILLRLVMKTVNNIKNASWMNVELSEKLVGLVDEVKSELEKPEYHGRASVTPKACPQDTCRVATDEGTVVSNISVQADILREAFRAGDK